MQHWGTVLVRTQKQHQTETSRLHQ